MLPNFLPYLHKNVLKLQKPTIYLILFLALAGKGWGQTLLAGWTFDATTGTPTTPTSVAANLGLYSSSATLYANGTNGSSSWAQATELDAFGGNTTNDPRASTNAGNTYSLVAGTSQSANGKAIVLTVPTTGYRGITLTFSTRGTSTGFTTGQWAYSTNGSSFTNIGSNTATTSATVVTRTVDLSAVSTIENVATLYLRYTVTGASGASGNNRLDNIQVTSSNSTWYGGTSVAFATQANWIGPVANALNTTYSVVPTTSANINFQTTVTNQPNFSGSAISLGDATFLSGSTTTLTNSGANNLTFTGPISILGNNPTFVASSTGNIVSSGVISGSGKSINFNASGTSSGDFRLSGTNSYDGGTNVTGGTGGGRLRIDAVAALPTTGTVAISTGGRITLNIAGTYGGASQALTFNPNQTTNPSLDILTNAAVIWQGTVAINADTRIESNGSSGSLTFSGATTGSGTLIKQAAGNLVLSSSSNNLTGGTQIGNGTLTVNSGSSMGTGDLLLFQTLTNNTALNLNESQTVSSLASNFTATIGTQTQRITVATNKVLTINQSATTTFGTGAVATLTSTIEGAGGITKSGSGTLSLTSANTYTGTTTVSGGTLQLNRTGGGTIPSTNAVSVSGGTLRISSDQTLASLTVTSGTVQVDAGVILTITGNVSIPSGANLILNGTLTSSGSRTLTVASGATITIGNAAGLAAATGTFSAGKTFTAGANYLVTVATTTPLGLAIVANNFTTTESITLDAALGVSNTLSFGNVNSKTITTAGNLTLLSTASATSRIADITNAGANTGNAISGNITVQRYIPAKTARYFSFLSSPVSQSFSDSWQQQMYITGPGTGGTICTASPVVNSNGFDATQNNLTTVATYEPIAVNNTRYITIPNTTSTSLIPGVGYRVNIRGARGGQSVCENQLTLASGTPAPDAVTLSATGTYVSSANRTVYGLSASSATTNAYTLLGNPFPSEISFNSFRTTNSAIISDMAWMLSPNNGNTAFHSISAGTAAGTWPSGYITGSAPNQVLTIPSGAAFFVRRTTAVDAMVSFTESHKTTTVANGNTLYSRNQNTNSYDWRNFVRVTLRKTDSSFVDDAIVRFINDATISNNNTINDLDGASFNTGLAQNISTLKLGNRLTFHTRTSNYLTDTVLLDVRSNVNGNLLLKFTEFEQYAQAGDIFLRDKWLNITQDVKANAVYPFTVTADPASIGANRFELIFRSAATLPVSFISINAIKKGTDNEVTFSVAKDEDAQQYQVERSTNGVQFAHLQTVAAKGITGTVTYTITDKNATSATVYYRVKAIEKNGLHLYSRVVSLKNGQATLQLTLTPNPVKDVLTITTTEGVTGKLTLRIINQLGETVLSNGMLSLNSNHQYALNVSNLASGIYRVELSDGKAYKAVGGFVK